MIVSSCGVDYSYTATPERVLLGAPGIADTLDALGVGDRVIGTALSDYASEGELDGLDAVTADYTPSREFLIGTAPDFFLSNDEQQLTGDGAASKDDLASIPANLYVLGGYCAGTPAPDTVEVVYDDIDALGRIFDVEDTAAALNAELRDRVDAASALNTDGEQLTAAAITVFDGTVYGLSGSYYGAILTALGMENVFSDLGANFAEITAEEVLAADPDVIIVTYFGTPEAEQAAIAEATTLFANSSAVADGRVYGLDEFDLQSVGVRIVDAIETTARQVFAG